MVSCLRLQDAKELNDSYQQYQGKHHAQLTSTHTQMRILPQPRFEDYGIHFQITVSNLPQ